MINVNPVAKGIWERGSLSNGGRNGRLEKVHGTRRTDRERDVLLRWMIIMDGGR